MCHKTIIYEHSVTNYKISGLQHFYAVAVPQILHAQEKYQKDDNPFCSWEITLELIPAPLTWLKHTLLLYWIAVTENVALIKTIFVILPSSSLITFSTAVKSFDIWVNFNLFQLISDIEFQSSFFDIITYWKLNRHQKIEYRIFSYSKAYRFIVKTRHFPLRI